MGQARYCTAARGTVKRRPSYYSAGCARLICRRCPPSSAGFLLLPPTTAYRITAQGCAAMTLRRCRSFLRLLYHRSANPK